jgi:hypothetical protein
MGPYLVYGGLSTSAILFYQFPSRHRRHLLLLPILTAAALTDPNVPYLRAILLFSFQPRSVFLWHSCSSPTSTANTSLAAQGGVAVYTSTYHSSSSSSTTTFGSSRTSSARHIHNHTISISYLALLRPNSFFLRHSLHLILHYKGPNSFLRHSLHLSPYSTL